ncbi:MAG: hypothetical protein JST38_15750 [Bacteroidetes bacterium]|nr:hypothetical protein [Bacteroidota bacterium]
MKTDNFDKELRAQAPRLGEIPKADPFLVEKNFFDRFPHEVQALAAKPNKAAWPVWVKRAAIALPAMAVLLFAVHTLRPTSVPMAVDPQSDDQVLAAVADQMGTEEILDATEEADWPEFSTVTVQLTPEEAAAYVDQNQIDLNEYLY